MHSYVLRTTRLSEASSIRPYCCNADCSVHTNSASLFVRQSREYIQELEFQTGFEMTRDCVLREWEL